MTSKVVSVTMIRSVKLSMAKKRVRPPTATSRPV